MKKGLIRKLALVAVLVPVAILTSALVIGKDQQKTAQDKMPRSITANRLPKAVTDKLHAQAVRVKAAEDEARALLKRKQYAAAETACRRALAITPKIKGKTLNLVAWQLLGHIYMEQGRYREALPFLTNAAQNTRHDEVNLDTALCYLRLGDLERARQFYSDRMILRYIDHIPDYQSYVPGTGTAKTLEASILFARGIDADLHARTGNTEKAVLDYTVAAKIVPTNGMIAYFQAMGLKELKRSREALSCFTRAVAYGKSHIVREATYQLSTWPNVDRERALKEAAKLKAAKS